MIARLVECTDYKMVYGMLEIKNVDSIEEVQNKIYEIKNKFNEQGIDDWSNDDIFEKFPEEWDWNFISEDCILEI